MKPSIYMVDDDTDFQTILRSWLEPLYSFVALKSGDELLGALKSGVPDLVILDLNLPGADGFELCGHLRDAGSGRGARAVSHGFSRVFRLPQKYPRRRKRLPDQAGRSPSIVGCGRGVADGQPDALSACHGRGGRRLGGAMNLLDAVVLLLILSWIGGFSVRVGGGQIHVLLAIALILLIVRLVTGKRL